MLKSRIRTFHLNDVATSASSVFLSDEQSFVRDERFWSICRSELHNLLLSLDYYEKISFFLHNLILSQFFKMFDFFGSSINDATALGEKVE